MKRIQTEKEKQVEAFFLRLRALLQDARTWGEVYKVVLKDAKLDAKSEGCTQALPDIVARKFVRHTCAVIVDGRSIQPTDFFDAPQSKLAVFALANLHRKELLRAIRFAEFEAAQLAL